MAWIRCGGGGDESAELLNSIVNKTVTDLTSKAITGIANSFFNGYSTITNVNLENCLTVGNDSFTNCGNIETISFPNLTSIGSHTFRYCHKLTNVTFPKVTSAGQGCLRNCNGLTSINFPLLTAIPANFCQDDGQNLKLADLGAATHMYDQAFWACTKFDTLILRANQVCTLGTYAIDYYTPFANGTGTIYVPQDLITSYQADSNWANLLNAGNQILPIEGSIYEI